MLTQVSDSEPNKTHKKSPHNRANFSKCGKLCDQTFYLEGAEFDLSKRVELEVQRKKSPRQSTTAFSSVSRQVQQNLRFSIPLPVGEFTHYPNHLYGRSKSPTWSFPKKERYSNQKIKQYEICRKHPIMKQQMKEQQENMYSSASSIKESLKGRVSLNKSSSMCETMDQTKNYSIILPRKTSAVDFFSKTKIKNPFYLTRVQIMNQQQKLQKSPIIEPCPKGYIEFYKKRPRQPNRNVKGFQTFLQSYYHQKQYDNFQFTQHPTTPNYHIDFNKHLDRNFQARETQCPNLSYVKIDFARVNKKNIDLNTSKFRAKIKTRYDRAEPEPKTRIDYDPPANDLGGMVTMQKTLSRNKQLFPIIDPAIKKAGDKEMKQMLSRQIPTKQINEAMRPKCNTRIDMEKRTEI